ncbi:DUF805 domain-containing protein [Methylobacterium dankookense]|uniref:Inner membrane protein YhaI n=1 Tax=Methylobacterium dankookense TaxID=560405 RepID=A0A564FZX2_9HYPH|nr:DUF805 domain-containing protein [Methylobacterium dankookense]GJD54610.1 hypothetical protein IFDJLNFL_0485 [Methylobacterium dankookense]VUF13522.1 Inner membrane protein YhaI [Methylobacterium dankookense]
MKALLFSAQGRIGRGQFWKGVVLSTLAMLVVLTVANLILAQFVPNEASDDGGFKATGAAAIPMVLANFAVIGLFAWSSICLGIKRFHDRGKPGIWVLISFVPIIGGIWYLIETGFLKGTDGANAYGPDPLAGSLPAGALAAAR